MSRLTEGEPKADSRATLIVGSIHDDSLLAHESFTMERFPSPLIFNLSARTAPAKQVPHLTYPYPVLYSHQTSCFKSTTPACHLLVRAHGACWQQLRCATCTKTWLFCQAWAGQE